MSEGNDPHLDHIDAKSNIEKNDPSLDHVYKIGDRDRLAKEFANDIKSAIRAVVASRDCPRDVFDPGKYFGYIAGWNACVEQFNLVQRSVIVPSEGTIVPKIEQSKEGDRE